MCLKILHKGAMEHDCIVSMDGTNIIIIINFFIKLTKMLTDVHIS